MAFQVQPSFFRNVAGQLEWLRGIQPQVHYFQLDISFMSERVWGAFREEVGELAACCISLLSHMLLRPSSFPSFQWRAARVSLLK